MDMIKPEDCNNHEFDDEDAPIQSCIHCGASFTKIPRKPGYRGRADAQLASWVAGKSIHNSIDGECCPDFSCCSDQRTPRDQRDAFLSASDRDRERMLMTFLSRGIERMGKGGKVHIAGREQGT